MSIEPAEVLAALLSGALVFVCVAVAWRGMSATRVELRQDALLLPWSIATALAWHPALVSALLDRALFAPLPGDSLLTLSARGRAGVVAIAIVGALVPFALSVAKTRALRRGTGRRATPAPAALDLVATTLVGLGALALAPQLFYAWYRRLFPELPARWVVEGLPSGERLAALARPLADGSVADHAAALMLWTLVLACLLGWLLDVRRRRRPLGALRAAGAVAALAALWSLVTLPLA